MNGIFVVDGAEHALQEVVVVVGYARGGFLPDPLVGGEVVDKDESDRAEDTCHECGQSIAVHRQGHVMVCASHSASSSTTACIQRNQSRP